MAWQASVVAAARQGLFLIPVVFILPNLLGLAGVEYAQPAADLLAFALAEWVSAALPWLMSAAAGCMVCVTAQEMIPQAVEEDEPAGVVSIVLGFALMMALDVAL